jgi:hypothetical protein
MATPSPNRERLRLAILVIVLAIVVVVAAVRFLGTGGMAAGSEDADELDYAAHDIALLALEALGQDADPVVRSGGNPFAFRPPPTPTPNLTPPPTPVPRPTLPPRPTPTPRIARGLDGEPKPPPPPFNREYIGYLGPRPLLVAAFRAARGDDAEIEVAAVGDVLDGIYIVRSVGHESVTIGFVGYDVSEDTSVPLSEK